jgi:hypothetical protein
MGFVEESDKRYGLVIKSTDSIRGGQCSWWPINSTIMDADMILVVKDGDFVELGTPRELLRRHTSRSGNSTW